MEIKNIAVIGLGLIGGSIAKALKKTALPLKICAFDKDEVLKLAKAEETIDEMLHDPLEAVQADLIFICLPVNLSLKIFEDIAPLLKENSILTDVCGVKSIFQEKWNSIDRKGIYIGGHPMTGKEKGGYINSDPLLFENSVYIVSDEAKKYPEKESFLKIIKALGARIIFVNPKLHDEVVANVSHLPQLLSVSLLNLASVNKNNSNFLDYAAGGFRDMTRIALSDFNIWEPIITHNKNEILLALDSMIEELKSVKEMIRFGNFEKLSDKFERARITRDEIPKNTKGFLNPLHDIFVFVRDEPGVISRISTALYETNINIKDIELLKIREGTGGTFRFSFDSAEDASDAVIIIHKLGYDTNLYET